MHIQTKDLRDFFKRSGKIKSNGIIPIHDYLLFQYTPEGITITKSNGNAFCKHTVEEVQKESGSFAVEEKRLAALVSNAASSELITFEVKGNQITMKDGKRPTTVQAGEVKSFQTFPTGEDADKVILNPDVLAALFEARNFVHVLESNFGFVYAHKRGGKHYVFASNRYVLYCKRFEDALPDLALSAETCAIVSSFGHVEYYTAGNYDFFDTGKTVYGFIKTTYTAPEYFPVIESVDRTQEIKLDKEKLLSFCGLVDSLAVSKFPIINFQENNDVLTVSYNEHEHNVNTEEELEHTKNFYPDPFSLNATQLTNVLKCFTTKEIFFSPNATQRLYGVMHPEEEGLVMAITPVMYNK